MGGGGGGDVAGGVGGWFGLCRPFFSLSYRFWLFLFKQRSSRFSTPSFTTSASIGYFHKRRFLTEEFGFSGCVYRIIAFYSILNPQSPNPDSLFPYPSIIHKPPHSTHPLPLLSPPVPPLKAPQARPHPPTQSPESSHNSPLRPSSPDPPSAHRSPHYHLRQHRCRYCQWECSCWC